jgi:predicted permease
MQVAELAFRLDRHDSPEKQRETIERIGPRVAAISGVESVSPVLSLPFSGVGGIYGRLGKPGESEQQLALNPMVTMEVVAPNYFTTLGLRILRGRPFSEQDGGGAPQVIVVSEAAARHYWPGVDPIGKELASGIGSGRLTVVGLVRDVRYVDLRETRPTIYFPIRQSFFAVTPTTLLIRSRSPGLAGAALADPIRLALREEGSGVDLASITSLESLLARPMAQPRLNALLLSIFAAAAVSLAGVGLFGVIAATVRQRTRELGIRMALGASRTAVRQLLTARGLKIAAAGVLAGVVGSLAVTRLVSTLLFGVSPADPLTLGATVGLILVVSVTASLIPALAGSRIDPATTLRAEG